MASDPTDPQAGFVPRAYPWTRLFRATGIAFDPRKLVLAAIGLGLLAAGWAGLDRLFPASAGVTPPVLTTLSLTGSGGRPGDDWAIGGSLPGTVAAPARMIVAPFFRLFDPTPPPGAFWHSALAALWAAAVWGIVGGAIARMAVVEVASDRRPGLGSALRFALGHALPLIGAPLTPLLGVACLAGLCGGMGVLYRIPIGALHAGLGLLLFLPLLAGLVMAVILLGLAAGWPLMLAAVAAEGEDGFDAISRAYGYVYQRPGRYAAYVALAWGLGVAGLVVAIAFARATIGLAHWGLSIGAPDAVIDPLFRGGGLGATAATHAAWLRLVDLLAIGWVFAYFWTSAAIVYLLLRHDVDGTDWHAVEPVETAAIPDSTGPGPEVEAGPAPPA